MSREQMKARLEAANDYPGHVTIAESQADVAPLVAALDAVEDLCAYWETLAGGDRHYATAVREAIKRGLEEEDR